ncbi:MAG: D-alanine--D-alanine ligase [Phascolarctobacterium sp.]|nr:D-alanine--D-alanine ligase [Phascolarctobacterium sp.]
MNKKDVVAVVLGGPSEEREVSRNTGHAICEALKEKGYNAQELELVPHTLIGDLKNMQAKVVFNAVHGLYGEDGRLQGMLDAAEIPYTGCGVCASAISMDKVATKRFLLSAGISTPDCFILHKRDAEDLQKIKARVIEHFGIPVVIKAASQGSSIGVYIIKKEAEIISALEECFKLCDHVLVEECITGKELTVSIMEEDGKTVALPIIWIAPHSGAYDYHSKYTKGATDYHCPAPLSKEVTDYIQGLALETYHLLDLNGVARVDIMYDDEKNIGYVLEANTVPGMTSTSLVPKAARAAGIEFPELCEKILLSAK